MANGMQSSNNTLGNAAKELQLAANAGDFKNFGGIQAKPVVSLKGAPAHQLAIFNINIGGNISNGGATAAASAFSKIPIELFYAQNSCTQISGASPYNALNANLTNNYAVEGGTLQLLDATATPLVPVNFQAGNTAFSSAPSMLLKGFSVTAAGTVGGINPASWATALTFSFWDADGNLYMFLPSTSNTSGNYIKISAQETNYRALFGYSMGHSFNVPKMRWTTSPLNNGSQFQNPLVWVKSTWLGGVTKQTIGLATYTSGYQFNPSILEFVNTPLKFDRQKGLTFNLNAGEIPGAFANGAGNIITMFSDGFTQPMD